MKAYHYLSSKHALAAIRNQRLKAAEYTSLNDPFELNAANLANRDVRTGIRSFANYWARHNAICSFSMTWKEPLMWSHYADKHRGAVLEFNLPDRCAIPVIYSSAKVHIEIERIKRDGFDQDHANRLIMTKYSGWSYEEEVRLVFPLSQCVSDEGLFFYPFDAILRLTGIIIGPLSDLTFEDVKNAKTVPAPLSISKARLGFTKYEVVKDRTFRRSVV